MDMTWVTDRIAVGGGIWFEERMIELVRLGITHIIDMQIEFDDRKLVPPRNPAGPNLEVLWLLTHDDFEPKRAGLFRRGVRFAQTALRDPEAKLFIHCAAGVHRAPMMALAVLGSMGWDLEEARDFIEDKRPVADFPEVYVQSVEDFLAGGLNHRGH
jgi:protein-tyrosine phosphatase